MAKPLQNSEGHGHLDATGKGHHESSHADAKAALGTGQIGQPFTPMTHNAPVQSLSTRKVKVQCQSCGAGTFWHPHLDIPPCAHCQGFLNPSDVYQ